MLHIATTRSVFMSYNQLMYALGSKRSVIREIFEYSKQRAAEIGPENVFDFSLGNPSVEPPREVAEALRSLLETQNSALHAYTSAQGDPKVRRAVAEYIEKSFGTSITPDYIYMTCGAAASLCIVLRAILNPGEECVVPAPFFTEYRVFVENAGGKLVPSTPLPHTFQLDIEDMAKKVTPNTKCVIINSPNNPSGVVYTEQTLQALCELLKQKSAEYAHPIYLISDEPYRELVFGEVEVPYLMNYYPDTFVCYSWSKSLSLPGERIGYIAVCPQMQNASELYLAVCGAGRSLGYVCAPSLFQQLIPHVLGKTADLDIYKQNRDLIYNALTQYGYECVHPDGAFYLFVKAPGGDATAFCERAKEQEILVVPCDDFGVSGYVRIAYCVDKERIERSLPGFLTLARQYGLI